MLRKPAAWVPCLGCVTLGTSLPLSDPHLRASILEPHCARLLDNRPRCGGGDEKPLAHWEGAGPTRAHIPQGPPLKGPSALTRSRGRELLQRG